MRGKEIQNESGSTQISQTTKVEIQVCVKERELGL